MRPLPSRLAICCSSTSSLYPATRTTADCPSGQWERTVNPSAYAYPGSNPGSATEVNGYLWQPRPFEQRARLSRIVTSGAKLRASRPNRRHPSGGGSRLWQVVYRRANRSARGTGFSMLFMTGRLCDWSFQGSRHRPYGAATGLRSTRFASAPLAPQLMKADCRVCARSSRLHVSLRHSS
jgi:hypothetical protein